jgi:hypothetical protein
VAICIIRQIPSRDPKFHQVLILVGAGRSISAPLAILIKGCEVRIGLFIILIAARVLGIH